MDLYPLFKTRAAQLMLQSALWFHIALDHYVIERNLARIRARQGLAVWTSAATGPGVFDTMTGRTVISHNHHRL